MIRSVERHCDGQLMRKSIQPIEYRHYVDHVTIRFAICRFLSVFLCNGVSISIGFRDIRSQTS